MKKVSALTIDQLRDIIRETLNEALEHKLQPGCCPVCGNNGYLKDPVTGVQIACFCRTGTNVLCVKNPPDLFV